MKIALFLGNAGKNSGGPEVYEIELLRSLARIDKKNDYHIFFLFEKGPEKVGVQPENFTYHMLRPDLRAISLSVTLPLALRKLNADAVHSTFIPPLLIPERMAYTLPCTGVFEHPGHYPLPIRVRLQVLCGLGIRYSQNVVCISEHVRQWLRHKTGLPEERLPLVPLGVSTAFRPMAEEERRAVVQDKYGLAFPYFLYSGRWERRKNLPRLIQAFARFKRERDTAFKLVLSGERTWASQEVDALIKRLGLHDSVVDLGKSPLEDLPALYGGAAALMYPSLWESFGLPIVEAMRCGTPVMTSKTSAMPETAGGAALLVDPFSAEEMAEAMDLLSQDVELRQRLRDKGLLRAEYFSWDATAEKSLEIYSRLACRN